MNNEKLLLQLTILQYCIIANQRAYDDDLASTWDEVRKAYVKLQRMMEDYIIEGEC